MTRKILVTVFLIFSSISGLATEYQLRSMGGAQFLFPQAEVDYRLNPAFLGNLDYSSFQLSMEYQLLRESVKSYSGVLPMAQPHSTAIPDEVASNFLYRGVEFSEFARLGNGVFTNRILYRNFVGLNEIQRKPFTPHPLLLQKSVLTDGESIFNELTWEIGYARRLKNNVWVGFRAIPFSTEIFKNQYYLLNFNYSKALFVQSPRNFVFQMGGLYQVASALKLGLSGGWQYSTWYMPDAIEKEGRYFESHVTTVMDVKVSRRSVFRASLGWRRFDLIGSHFEYKPSHPYIPITLPDSLVNYSSHYPAVRARSDNDLWTWSMSYSYDSEHFRFVLGASIERGWVSTREEVVPDDLWLVGAFPRQREWVYNARLALGVDAALAPWLRVQSGFHLQDVGREEPGIFSSSDTRTLSRIPTIGLSIAPIPHIWLGIGILPAAGDNIVSSSLENKNFYQLHIQYLMP